MKKVLLTEQEYRKVNKILNESLHYDKFNYIYEWCRKNLDSKIEWIEKEEDSVEVQLKNGSNVFISDAYFGAPQDDSRCVDKENVIYSFREVMDMEHEEPDDDGIVGVDEITDMDFWQEYI